MSTPELSPERRYHLDKNYMDNPVMFGSIALVQIGRMHCTENTVISTHTHRNWFELTLIDEGVGTILTNGEEIAVRAGDIHCSFPGDFHAIHSNREHPLKYNFFSFWTEDAELFPMLEEIIQRCYLPAQRLFADERIASLVGNAIAELSAPTALSERILTAIFLQIVLYLISDFRLSPERAISDVAQPEELCFQMMNYIDTHLYYMQSLTELAAQMNYSYSYLSDLFRRVTGDTLTAYYRDRRLKAAQLLLREGKKSVGEIAALLQYSSIYTFSRAFREQFGTSPTQYRQHIKN